MRYPRIDENERSAHDLQKEAVLILVAFEQRKSFPDWPGPVRLRKSDDSYIGKLQSWIEGIIDYADLSDGERGWFLAVVGTYNYYHQRLI
jgi:hypothetical protein